MPESATAATRRWWVLAIVSAAQFLTILDLWVVNIALPALIQPPLFAAADAAPRAELASGSAVLSMARQVGSALGVAILVAVLGAHPASAPGRYTHAWVVVLVSAALTGLAGLACPGHRTTTAQPRPGWPHDRPASGNGNLHDPRASTSGACGTRCRS